MECLHSIGEDLSGRFDILTILQGLALAAPLKTAIEVEAIEDLHNRMQYVINTVGYGRQASKEEAEAIERRYRQEQDARNAFFQKDFFRMIGKKKKKAEYIEVKPREADAKWHISYYGDKDKAWEETVMTEFKCMNYELVGSIDECIEKFRIRKGNKE